MQSTNMHNFNWADDRVSSHPSDTAVAFFLASHYNRPEAAVLQRRKLLHINGSVNDVIDYTPIGSEADLDKLPKLMLYKHRDVLVVRGSWSDEAAPFLGIKGGNVSYHHSHMDLGTFVLEFQGHRFAMDLGSDNYGLPEYFGGKRFTYYRLRNVGHNTLTFDDDNQGRNSAAEITNMEGNSDEGKATIDLTHAYAPSNLTSVTRTASWSFKAGQASTIQLVDEIEYGKSRAEFVTWAMHTSAEVHVSDTVFTLEMSSKSITITFDKESECPGAKLAANALDLKPPQYPTTGISRLTIMAPAHTCSKIAVTFAESH